MEEKARAAVAAMHRGVEGAMGRWKRHWRRSGCAGDRAIRRGICADMVGVVARLGRGEPWKMDKSSRSSECPGGGLHARTMPSICNSLELSALQVMLFMESFATL